MNIIEKLSFNYRINGAMGQDSLLPDINTEEIESNWHLFEQRIYAPEPPNQNCASKFNQESTKFIQSDLAMAPKMRGSLTNITKAKAQEATKAKKKAAKDEKKMSSLQQRLNRIRKAKIDEHNWPKHWTELRQWGRRQGT